MSISPISQKSKSPETPPTLPTLSGIQTLPTSLTGHISSFLSYTPQTVAFQKLVSHAWIQQLPVKNLDLSNSFITDEELIAQTQQFKDTLVSIDLSHCPNITDKGLKYLAAFKKLESLKISGNQNITDQGFVPTAPAAQSWSLLNPFSWMQPTQPAKPAVAFARLKNLGLTNCSGITGEAIKNFPKGLTSLTLSETRSIGNDDLVLLSSLENLKSLNLNYCYMINSKGLQNLAPLQQLTALSLNGCRNIGGDDGMTALVSLSGLKELDLSQTSLQNQDLRTIGALVNLDSLKLNRCHTITNQGIASLFRLPLSHLDLRLCPQINKFGIANLKDIRERIYQEDRLVYLNQEQPITSNSTDFQGSNANELHSLIAGYIEAPEMHILYQEPFSYEPQNWWEER